MEPISINEITKAVNGELLSSTENFEINHINTNSKNIDKNSLFVPIVGEHFDAHEFITDAFNSGSLATFTEKQIPMNSLTDNKAIIKVNNSLEALQKFAAWYRSKLKTTVVSVTGSVGKTSTKEMIYCAISQKHNVLKTFGNQNSQIGVPLTIFNIEKKHEFAVVEMGMSEFDEMQRISNVAKPNFCVITNIGISHIENLKSKENILKEKLHAADYIGEKGILFLNGDDPILLQHYKDNRSDNFILFGENEHCQYRATEAISDGIFTEFKLICPFCQTKVKLPAIGRHNIKNALAAIAVALNLGLDIEEIKKGLLKYENPKMRQQIYNVKGITIIDDSYNASPDSIKSGIDVLKSIKAKRCIIVVADMLELGEFSENAHFELGQYIAKKKLDYAVCIGKFANNISDGINTISNKTDVKISKDNKQAYCILKSILKDGDAVLVKGSRAMHTEQIVNYLLNDFS